MKKALLSLFFIFPFWAFGFDHSHKSWTQTLGRYQSPEGLIYYSKLKSEADQPAHPFVKYLGEIQSVKMSEFEGWTASQKKAFLINSYNALTVQLILKNYPVKSIKKIGGLFTKPWSVEFFKLLDGKITSLDPIEHEWLRPVYKDYRIHAAVNCASFSCPPLRHEAFVADKLDAQLDDQMKVWLADRTRNQLDASVLKISKIFDWYKKDFEQWGGGVVTVLSKFAGHPLKSQKFEYLDYNWDLNEAR